MNIIKFIKNLFKKDKVLFCDLDGTIIVTKSGETFPKDCYDWQFKKGIIDAIKAYNPTAIHIITNQGGIEKGFVNGIEFANIKMPSICEQLSDAIGLEKRFVTWDMCTSNDKNNYCRKPNAGMIDLYVHDYISGTDCDKKDCLMIGDASGKEGNFSDSDYMTAHNAGIKYCDVDDFIAVVEPCNLCFAEKVDCADTSDPMLPCNDTYEYRLSVYTKR